MHFKCFIFDLDGTLTDTVADLTAAFNFMCRKMGFAEVNQEVMARLIGNGMRDVIQQAFTANSVPQDVQQQKLEEALKTMLDYYMQHLVDFTRPYEGVAETLAALKQADCKLAVVTNKFTSATVNILRPLQLEQYFDCILGNGEGFPLKPAPDLLFEAARRTGTPVADCVMVGDNHTDLGAARRAGICSVFVRYGYGTIGDEKPGIYIDKFNELKAFI